MKKQAFAALIALLTLTYCHKSYSGHYHQPTPFTDSTQALIQAAHAWLDHQPAIVQDTAEDLPLIPSLLHKTPLWGQAKVQTFTFGKGVVVPLHIDEPLSLHVAGQPLDISRITWLLLYKDTTQHWQAQVITRLPDDNLPGRFQGTIRVTDWQGYFQKAYRYLHDSVAHYTQQTLYRRPGGPQPAHTAPTLIATIQCTETDWYACYTYDGVDAGCDYAYTEEECTISSISPLDDGGGSAPSPSDYPTIGGGSGGSSATSASPDIKEDPSISAVPIIQCVYANLMAGDLPHGLKTVLTAFNDNNTYNITFTLTPNLPEDGNTHYDGNNTWTIQLNAAEATDPTYSRIYLAATMIHEAFHAKLRQKAIATFGQATINQWPQPIDDMDLSQLANYFEAESKADNIWETVEHDWMVDNITDMATTLQSFIQTYYGTTYAAVGSSLAPYTALMYMGLQTSTLYQEQIIAPGLQPTVQSYWGALNEGGKCSD